MFAAECRAEKIHQFTKFLNLAATTDWSLRPPPHQNRAPSEALTVKYAMLCYYLETHSHPPEPGRRGRLQKRNTDSCYDGMNHVIVKQGKQTRCAECHKNTTLRCQKCDVALHVKCSVEYHTE